MKMINFFSQMLVVSFLLELTTSSTRIFKSTKITLFLKIVCWSQTHDLFLPFLSSNH